MHPAIEMETMMKTAKAAPAERSQPNTDSLRDRYGEIGISAVAAAARFTPAPKPATADQPRRQVVAMD